MELFREILTLIDFGDCSLAVAGSVGPHMSRHNLTILIPASPFVTARQRLSPEAMCARYSSDVAGKIELVPMSIEEFRPRE